MGRSKKKKQYQPTEASLTHDEIWDDSALIDSWDAAYEEYKKYHSLHARGESVPEALLAAEVEELAGEGEEDPAEEMETEAAGGEGADGTANSAATAPSAAQDGLSNGKKLFSNKQDGSQSLEQHAVTQPAGPTPSFPEAMLSMGPGANKQGDERLKNLMMSWYWAGYYTGFYEGQQGSQRNQDNNTNGTSDGAT